MILKFVSSIKINAMQENFSKYNFTLLLTIDLRRTIHLTFLSIRRIVANVPNGTFELSKRAISAYPIRYADSMKRTL